MTDEQPRPALDLPLTRALTTAQVRGLAESARLDAARRANRLRLDALSGTLAWRAVRGVEHLVHMGPSGTGDRRTRTRILGPRSAAMEALAARAAAERAEAAAAVREAEEALAMQAAANRSVRLGTVPVPAARALRALAAGGPGVVVLGAAALAGHLARSGRALAAGRGLDPLAPLRDRLVVAGADAGTLCRAMRARGEPGFVPRAANLALGPDGYVLEVAPGEPGNAVEACAVDVEGMPVPMRCPPLAAYVAERLAHGQSGTDDDAAMALAQGRAAVGCAVAGDGPGRRR